MNAKNTLYLSILSFSIFLGSLGVVPKVWSGDTVDHSLYADLLARYVRSGVVDYRGFKNEETKLDQYLRVLEKTDTNKLQRNEQFAFYINAYNAWTIKLTLSDYPGIKSLKDLGSLFKSPWKKRICRIDGDIITLDDIEHKILRPRFKDPRVHFAINCAAKSCPPLRSEPYRGGELDQQLDEMTRAFINDFESNRLEDHTLYISKIFKWFEDDFNKDVVGFFLRYAGGDLKKQLEANRDRIRIKYLDYDWSLNGR
ncbi:MAG: DUF547 domain-containing protein [Deltaproteobacteria bacterium]|nr:DUF547 domain-containing protein [Deltaproteobacteria bacterium]